ncbi:MAG: hypothetical protein A3C84_03055 [Candidatus Ryanbacteria bacterium RIFCSPHIGHO2_02_FULL_48_12]|uniref:Uncharacterized protein n=1 Tax=Candidatus Ryanbacteria bacterium RIFCSPHIGHO2_01_FULL_48_27 TaxID=1802115 RepID=A0A1G2G5E8_9BACT|nr:MAG: hypothetical protein A2756_01525 [Candidatus Ryanbacteria bacterium RIFCSPHIGHO2_01_FULL_48_27]OGZ49079.1 MAG: hypothetical protein A3C84_03055 [Candidatus Ryanbacteria bacterium RIFCSPHIGHO2_02_FULL_48_12]
MSEPELTLGRFLRALCYRMCFESGMTIYLGGNLWQWQAIFYALYKANMPGKPACIKNLWFTSEPIPRSRDVDEAVRALKDSLWVLLPARDNFYAPTIEARVSWVASNMLVEGHARGYLDLAFTLAKELFPTQPKPLH